MHCFACCGCLQKSLEFEELGPKRIAALEKEAEEWRRKAEDAVASIQDITVTYFALTSKALAGISCCVYFSVYSFYALHGGKNHAALVTS